MAANASVTFRERAAYLPAADALVLADVHVGRARRSNVEFPLGERGDLVDRLTALVDHFDPAEVVVAGDLLHSFDRVPATVADAVGDLSTVVREAGARMVVAPGNHDTVLEAAWDGPTDPEYRPDEGTVVCHGHEEPAAGADRYVVGHEHPAIVIEGRKRPCLLYGEGVYRDADVVVLPAFNRLARGTVVNGMDRSDALSAVVRAGASLDEYRPVVYDGDAGESLWFPPLGEFRRLL